MKLKVIEMFKDKYSDEIYPVDKILEVTEERGQELLNSSYVELIEKEDINDSIETDKIPVEDKKTNYSKMNKDELIKIAAEKLIEVPEKAKKEEIAALIEEFDNLPKE